MADQLLESQLVEKLKWASSDGCPVAGFNPDEWATMASVARRRWSSFQRRRNSKVEDDQANRVEDLARGLCEKFEQGGLRMAGPLITDYRWLANQLAEVFLRTEETTKHLQSIPDVLPVCPVCGGQLMEIRAKLQCSRCHTICETCCEGGRG